MSNVVGAVESINKNSGTTNGKKWNKLAVKVAGNWYSGFVTGQSPDDRASVKEGDTVEITYKVNGDYRNLDSLKIKPQEAGQAKGLVSATAYKQEEYTPSSVKDLRITAMSARNAAIDFVDLALKHEALTLGKVQNKKADILLEHVNYYTKVFGGQALTVTQEDMLSEVSTETQAESEEELSE